MSILKPAELRRRLIDVTVRMHHPLSLDRPITFFDLETTSAVVESARIVQIAMIRLEPEGACVPWSGLVNPGVPIEPGATQVHGISNADVANAPAFRELARNVCDMMRGADLGGFNVTGFDVPILDAELKRAGLTGGIEDPRVRLAGCVVVDVFDLECAVNTRTLGALYARYTGRELESSHDALADVKATIEVLAAQVEAHRIEARSPAALQDLARGDYLDAKRRFLRREDGEIVVSFGKHNGSTLRDLLRHDRGYVSWMCEKLGTEVTEIVSTYRREYV